MRTIGVVEVEFLARTADVAERQYGARETHIPGWLHERPWMEQASEITPYAARRPLMEVVGALPEA
jgi:hypothetical protein